MLYHHNPEFQGLLRRALKRARDGGASDQLVVDKAGLKCGRVTINRFRNDKQENEITRLSADDSRLLWNYLWSRGDVERQMREDGILSTGLYKIKDIANGMASFYGAEEKSITALSGIGLVGTWFCYKPSITLGKEHVVKSVFEIYEENEIGDYPGFLTIKERGSYRGDASGGEKHENSEGFVIAKDKQIWFVIRTHDSFQPKIFCSNKIETGIIHKSSGEKIVRMYGHVLEGSIRSSEGLHSFRIGLASLESDRSLWNLHYDENEYPGEKSIDIYPMDKNVGEYKNKKFCLDQEIIKYIRGQ